MSDKIVIDYVANVSGLQANLKTLQTEMKATEKAGVESASNTEKAFTKTETATKSLKAQLKELKNAQEKATDPAQAKKLAEAVGVLKDKIQDAADQAKIFSSDSKFVQIGTAFGSVVSKLKTLDFGDALAQSKLLVSTTKSLTFKEALGGIKDLGGTLLNIGKSLLANPLFLLGTAITLIISNFDKLKNSGGVIGAVFKGIGSIISFVIDGLEGIGNAIGLIDTKSAEQTQNLIANFDKQLQATKDYYDRLIALREAREKDATAIRIKGNNEQIQEANKLLQDLAKIRNGYWRQATNEEKLAQHNMNAIAFEAGKGLTKEEEKKWDELLKLINEKSLENEVLVAKSETAKLKKIKEANKKLHEEMLSAQDALLALLQKGEDDVFNSKKHSDLRNLEHAKEVADKEAQDAYDYAIQKGVKQEVAQLALNERLLQNTQVFNNKNQELKDKANYEAGLDYMQAEEAEVNATNAKGNAIIKKEEEINSRRMSLIEDRANFELKMGDPTLSLKLLDDKYKAEQQKYKGNQEVLTELALKYNRDRLAIEEQAEQQKRKLIEDTTQTVSNLLSTYSQISANESQREIDQIEEKKDASIKALDDELSAKQITQAEYDKKKKELEDKAKEEERKSKIKAFEAQKQASLIQATIATAQGIANALTITPAYLAVAQTAIVAALGAAQIAEISSQPTPKFEKGGKIGGNRHSQGGTLIEAERDEWIIRRDEAIKNDRLLSAINKGQADKFIYVNYIAPALKNQIQKQKEQTNKSFADSLAGSMMLNFRDENLLDSLKMSRKNDKEIAMYLVSELKNNNRNPRNV